MTRRPKDLMLGDVLEHMCDRNDHLTVLHVLQLLGKVHRAGYLTIDELVKCLMFTGNSFAEHGNGDFFREYVQYMPDINHITETAGHFTPLCKSYFFAYKHAEDMLNQLQTECMHIDTQELIDWFRHFIISKRINNDWQLHPLFDRAREHREITNEQFKDLCHDYVVPLAIKTGSRN